MPDQTSDLSQQVRSLQIQVDELTRLVRGLLVSQGPRTSAEWEEASAVPVSAPEASYRAPSSQASSSSVYNQLAEQIPTIPDFCLRLCSLLSAGSQPISQRAVRAWEAGHWARFTLEGKVSKPRPSHPCDVSNTVWVVLRCEGVKCPVWCSKASDYRSLVKDFAPSTVSHGFASKAEAKVYCLAAGFELPEHPYQWRP